MEITKKMIEQCTDLSTDERKVMLHAYGFAGNRVKRWVERKLPDDNYIGLFVKADSKLRALKASFKKD